MNVEQILRWLVTAIVLMIAVVLLGLILHVAGFLLKYAVKVLILLLLVAVVMRFIGARKSGRK